MMVHAGLLLPVEVLHSGWFSLFAAFVAVNSLLYLGLSIVKILPKPRLPRGRRERSETRSIRPDGPR